MYFGSEPRWWAVSVMLLRSRDPDPESGIPAFGLGPNSGLGSVGLRWYCPYFVDRFLFRPEMIHMEMIHMGMIHPAGCRIQSAIPEPLEPPLYSLGWQLSGRQMLPNQSRKG